ncbi:hypothetical protein GGR54DRAFT_636505 [Hypoxylon sp. NC1633]|nr:hypothetical protein GGR54DRAFT_636505 [Hypoxylon sp. NC1633]
MRPVTYLTCLALPAIGVVSAWNDFTDLHPILAPSYDTADPANIVPSTNVSLDYSLDNSADSPSSVSIDLNTDQPVILLESIGAVFKVACTYDTVTVAFSNTAAFQQAVSKWPRDGKFYLITNHLDNCDAGPERGIYRVASLSWDNDSATVTARTEKTDFATIATSLDVTFSQGSLLNNSGNITFDEPGIDVASNFSIPKDLDIFSQPPYFTATANDGYLSDAAIIRGHFNYDVPSKQLQSLWFDIDAALFGDLAVTFNVTAPLDNNNYFFSPGTFFPSAINVPGAFSLTPALRWGIGADVGAVGALYHSNNVSLRIPDGHAHVDFMNSNRSHVTGWSPRVTSAFTTREAATGHASPFMNFSIELSLDVLNGLFDVTGGIMAKPQFVNELNVAQSQTRIRRANRMIWPRNVTCSNGFEFRSAFNFSVTAFVTNSWERTLYNTEIPIEDKCYRF